jgi:hypothetical protein
LNNNKASQVTKKNISRRNMMKRIFANASDGGKDLLVITLDNQTAAPNAYAINEVYFNFAWDSSLFGFNSTNTGSGVLNDVNVPINADGFGTFDANITGFGLASGGTEVWQIDLGANGITMSDFDVLSSIPPGDIRAFVALKFVQGPGDDSAYGAAVVPVPAAVWLFGSGLLGLVGVARRKKT